MLKSPFKIRSHKGYTFMEIIVTLVIIGAMAGYAIPKLNLAMERSRSSEGIKILEALLSAQRMYDYEDHAFPYASMIVDLDVTIDDPAQNFDTHTTFNDPVKVAETTRIGTLYTLRIDEDGNISCGDEDASAVGWCKKIGFGASAF